MQWVTWGMSFPLTQETRQLCRRAPCTSKKVLSVSFHSSLSVSYKDTVLSPISLDSKIAEMYADAATHYPKNQEILTHLFMAYVRVGNYQKQQHTAIQLHKAFPDSGPYYCWRVMSILMQVILSEFRVKLLTIQKSDINLDLFKNRYIVRTCAVKRG